MKSTNRYSPLIALLLFLATLCVCGQKKDTALVNEQNQKAREFLTENKLEASLEAIIEAENKAIELNWKTGLLKVYATKSSIQNIYNKHYEAIATGLKGLQLAKDQKDGYYEALFYRSLANNHDMLDNYAEAIPYYQKCLETAVKIPGARQTMGHCYVEMGDAYRLHKKDPATARKLILQGIEIYKSGDSTVLGYAYDYLGEALTDLGLFKEAKESFSRSMAKYQENGDEYLMPELLFHTANMHLAQKDYPEAIKTAEKGLKMSKKMNTIYGESQAHRSLYHAHKATGNFPLALQHYEAYVSLKDSLTKANIDNHFEQIKTEAQLQKQESRLQELQLRHQKTEIRNQQIMVVTLILLLAAAALLIIYFRKLNNQLRNKSRRIAEALLSGQATERQRLSREIRDNVGASISSALWTFDLLGASEIPDPLQNTISSLKTNLSTAYQQINMLSGNITPEELEKIGLAEALNRLIRRHNETEPASFRIELPVNFKGTEPKIEFEIYNIVMELLLIYRKSSCRSGLFRVSLQGRKVYLQARGLGKGILADTDDLLLQQISFRVESLSGQLKIFPPETDYSELIISFRIPG